MTSEEKKLLQAKHLSLIHICVVGRAVISPSRPYRVINSITAFSTSASGLRPIISIPDVYKRQI